MKKIPCILIAAALFAAGCAKDVTTSDNALNKEYYEAWITEQSTDEYGDYPDASPTPVGNGIYILEEQTGSGAAYNGEDFVWVDYTASSMDGTISSTTDAEIAQRLQIYSDSFYYGPRVWPTYVSSLPVGLADVLAGMKIGGRRKALIPSWLMGYDRYDGGAAEYLKHTPANASTAIYDVTLRDFTSNMPDHQIKEVESYGKATYGQADSLSYGFYWFELDKPSADSEFASSDKVKINYIGRRMDGSVFDTSIERVAKDNGIWTEDRTYGPATVTWATQYSELKMTLAGSSESTAPITGFQRALWQLRKGSRGEGVFLSTLGYGTAGSGSASKGYVIPPYSPLRFEISFVSLVEE